MTELTHIAVLHAIGTEQDQDVAAVGTSAKDAATKAKKLLLESWDEAPEIVWSMKGLDETIDQGEVLLFIHEI